MGEGKGGEVGVSFWVLGGGVVRDGVCWGLEEGKGEENEKENGY